MDLKYFVYQAEVRMLYRKYIRLIYNHLESKRAQRDTIEAVKHEFVAPRGESSDTLQRRFLLVQGYDKLKVLENMLKMNR